MQTTAWLSYLRSDGLDSSGSSTSEPCGADYEFSKLDLCARIHERAATRDRGGHGRAGDRERPVGVHGRTSRRQKSDIATELTVETAEQQVVWTKRAEGIDPYRYWLTRAVP